MIALEQVALRSAPEDQREWVVKHTEPSRAMRRSARKTLRHNTVLYHAEMDRIRVLVAARNAKRSLKECERNYEAALIAALGDLQAGVKIGAGTIRVRLTKDSASDVAA